MKKISWCIVFCVIFSYIAKAQDNKQRFVLRTDKGVSYLYVKMSSDTESIAGAEEIYWQDFKETTPTKLEVVERIPVQDNSPKIKVKHPRTGKEYIFIDVFGMSADMEDGNGGYINWMPEMEFVLGNETFCCNSGPFFEPFYYSNDATKLPAKIEAIGEQSSDEEGNIIFKLKFPVMGVCTVRIKFGETPQSATATIITSQNKTKVFKENKQKF